MTQTDRKENIKKLITHFETDKAWKDHATTQEMWDNLFDQEIREKEKGHFKELNTIWFSSRMADKGIVILAHRLLSEKI